MAPADPKTGLLLVNLGTPASPDPADVRPYLREFLMDPRVLDVSYLQRWLIVNLFILPRRPKESGKAYASIWSDRGSPLLVYGHQLTDKLRQRLGDEVQVELGMRYGNPSIASALDRLRDAGVQRIVVFPLFPQYSSAATGSAIEKVCHEAGKRWNTPYLQFVPAYYDHPAFIEAFARVARPVIDRVGPERVFFSFHGLPERQIHRGDPGEHCLRSESCCGTLGPVNANCYRAQCHATARALADRLQLTEEQRVICFQSRLGRTPWIRPFTDEVLIDEAERGCKRAVILSPAFVADCLETLEELGMRGAESWREHGGEMLELIPSLNAEDGWADAVIQIAREQTRWLGDADS